jgi:hypothetical protein
MDVYGALIAARLEETDPTYLKEYASGTKDIAGQPLFGTTPSAFYGPLGRGRGKREE